MATSLVQQAKGYTVNNRPGVQRWLKKQMSRYRRRNKITERRKRYSGYC